MLGPGSIWNVQGCISHCLIVRGWEAPAVVKELGFRPHMITQPGIWYERRCFGVYSSMTLWPWPNNTKALFCSTSLIDVLVLCWTPSDFPDQLKMEFTGIFPLIKIQADLMEHACVNRHRSEAFIHPINLCFCYLLLYYTLLVGFSTLSLTISLFRKAGFLLLSLITKNCYEHDGHLY